MANRVQLYFQSLPQLTQGLMLDGVQMSVEAQDAAVVRRAANGSLWVQKTNPHWKKRRLTISGSGIEPSLFFGDMLHEDVVVTATAMPDLAGIVSEVRSPDRDVFGKVDQWSIVIEEY